VPLPPFELVWPSDCAAPGYRFFIPEIVDEAALVEFLQKARIDKSRRLRGFRLGILQRRFIQDRVSGLKK
jgi:hypothetical protein